MALDGVDADFHAGEIHAILGENGAGKSTLVGALAGFVRPDAGTASLNGAPLPFGDPLKCRRAGIELVHQHFMLVPALTVGENIELARMGRLGGKIGREAAQKAEEIGRDLGWPLDLRARVSDLTVGVRQRVEIIKSLVGTPSVLILDEPTATLAPSEITELFRVLRRLADSGTTILLIAHKLAEVMAVADRATVLRNGRLVAERSVEETTVEELAEMMIGRRQESVLEYGPSGEVVFEAFYFQPEGSAAVSFTVRKGEIFGIGGVDGNGQLALAEALAGISPSQGELKCNGQTRQPSAWRTGYIPEDRNRDGIAPEMTMIENLTPQGRRGFFLDRRELRAKTDRAIRDFDIRPARPEALAGELSGGNAQKLVLARALGHDLDLVIAANPTRGLDVGATETVHAALREIAARGVPVVLITTDLDELFALSARTGFLSRGQLKEGRDPALMTI